MSCRCALRSYYLLCESADAALQMDVELIESASDLCDGESFPLKYLGVRRGFPPPFDELFADRPNLNTAPPAPVGRGGRARGVGKAEGDGVTGEVRRLFLCFASHV